jgi:hypothetical protein
VVWVRVPRYYLDDQAWSEYEYLRVEFVDGRVVAVETARDPDPRMPPDSQEDAR